MNYLTAVEEIQTTQFIGQIVDAESATLMGVCFDYYPAPDVFSKINCLEPWLFAMVLGTQEEQRAYYRKVWKLHRHVNHQILLARLGLPMVLRLVTPNFSTLQVTILVDGKEGELERLILNQGDEEGLIYTLSRFPQANEWNGAEQNTHGRFLGNDEGF